MSLVLRFDKRNVHTGDYEWLTIIYLCSLEQHKNSRVPKYLYLVLKVAFAEDYNPCESKVPRRILYNAGRFPNGIGDRDIFKAGNTHNLQPYRNFREDIELKHNYHICNPKVRQYKN